MHSKTLLYKTQSRHKFVIIYKNRNLCYLAVIFEIDIVNNIDFFMT